MTGRAPLPGRSGSQATGQEERTVLWATILSWHDPAGEPDVWPCGDHAPPHCDDLP